MNRREFLVGSTLVFSTAAMTRLAGAGGGGGAGAMPSAEGFRTLRRGVGTFVGRGGTIGWLVNDAATAVVDSQFPDTAARCLAELKRVGPAIDVLVNTHHHPDHTGGNGVFQPAVGRIVAQANVPALQRAQAEQRGLLDQQVYAGELFETDWRREVGDEVLAGRYLGPAHTNGDITVTFERANVVHLGDLVFNRIYPVIDRVGGASVRHWVTVLETIEREYPKDAIYVCGHGGDRFGVTLERGELRVFRDYLSGLLDYTAAQIKAGKTKAEIVTLENLPGFDDFHTPAPNRLSGNLAMAYDELTEG